jgi:hypothetical protein
MTTPRTSPPLTNRKPKRLEEEPGMSHELLDRQKIKSAPLSDILKESELIPQAIVRRPVESFAEGGADVSSGVDDLDEYQALGFHVGNIPFTIMHYKGHPPDTSTVYLPHDVRDLKLINGLLKAIFSHFKLRNRDIAWQRKDGVDL